MQTVSSYNMFVDSDNALVGRGDDFLVQVGNAGIHCGDHQFIRVSLETFNMYKNFYGVNMNNNTVNVNTNLAAAGDISLTSQNYKSVGDIAQEFATQLASKLLADKGNAGAWVSTATTPALGLAQDSTTNKIISVTLEYRVNGLAAAHGITSCVLQCKNADGDSAYLLGGDRADPSDGAFAQSFEVLIATNTITVTGRYPAQRTTEEHVYLRTDLPNNNLETQGLTGRVHDTHVLSSDILAKIKIDHEFVHFESSTGKEFFLNVPNKSINSMRFYLRDSKDRAIPSAGSGASQKTKGNFHCSFVLRFDVLQYPAPPSLNSAKVVSTIPARHVGLLSSMLPNL